MMDAVTFRQFEVISKIVMGPSFFVDLYQQINHLYMDTFL